MENGQDKLQVENAPSSDILSTSLQMVSQTTNQPNEWWPLASSSAPTTTHYLGLPEPYPQYSSLPSYTSSQSDAYPSNYQWEESYSVYPNPRPEPASTQAYPNPPAYPYSSFRPAAPLPCNYYPNSLSPMDESPVSSPESLDTLHDNSNNSCSYGSQTSLSSLSSQVDGLTAGTVSCGLQNYKMTDSFAPMGLATHLLSIGPQPVLHEQKSSLKKQVRMPQRKGGIQLWQFLYSLLSDTKYSNIIEWTSNRLSNEFRMLEPESIAVWWGTIKSKPTMTYDKFSRSLRYYYHKGILKKIPGERYMYRFLVDPEDMYRHIGATDKRPELKTMPKEAKLAMGMFHKLPKSSSVPTDRLAIVTEPPESLPARSTPSPRFNGPAKNTIIVDSFGTDCNNSNNINTSFSFTPSQPIPIAAGAW